MIGILTNSSHSIYREIILWKPPITHNQGRAWMVPGILQGKIWISIELVYIKSNAGDCFPCKSPMGGCCLPIPALDTKESTTYVCSILLWILVVLCLPGWGFRGGKPKVGVSQLAQPLCIRQYFGIFHVSYSYSTQQFLWYSQCLLILTGSRMWGFGVVLCQMSNING